MSEEIRETPSATPNFQTDLAAQLAELMPEVVADGKVDVEKLMELLDGDAADTSERFGLFWPGKKRALRAAQEPTTATLRPDLENSKDWDTTKNVFIEGDNLEVLKILQKHYHAKIKMIYIDPPYNTGNDFVYPDNYKEGLDTYLEWTRQVNEDGKKLSTNADTEGRYHSNWLNMMYPRLKLARNLLTDDGFIFISIDGHEVAHLRRVCDEVFGEACFKNMIAVRRGIKNVQAQFEDIDALSAGHEYILLYSRRPTARLPKLEVRHADQKPGKWDTFWRGTDRPTMRYDLLGVHPERGQWRWEAGRSAEAVENHEAYLAETERTGISLDEYYLDHLAATNVKLNFVRRNDEGVVQYYVPPSSGKLLSDNWMDLTLSGAVTEEFDTEKSVGLMRRMVEWVTGDGDTVFDFFSGSGTTGEAVLRANVDDGKSRHWIQVQLPEPILKDSTAVDSGLRTVSDITRKRLVGVRTDILTAHQGRGSAGDIGFRSYVLADTNFSKWKVSSDVDRTELEQRLFDLRASSSADGASADDLLSELLLKQGYSLTEQIAPVDVAGLNLRSVGDGIVLAYLNEHVKPTLQQLRAVVNEDPARLIILEDAFQGDDQLKTNLAQLCKSKGIELWAA